MRKPSGLVGFGAAVLLVACGGGGGGGSSPPAPNPAPPPPAPPAITGPAAALPAATAGSAAPGATITATGAMPITFTISAGSLPDGMTLNANTGGISGTPLVLGTFDFTVTATNTAGTASAPFSQIVNPAIPNANLLLTGNRIVSFNTNVPTALEAPVDIRFLPPGHEVVAIARRVNTGFLYGFALDGGGTAALYVLHPATGVALGIGSAGGFSVPITGTRFGAHVSPAADVLRITTDTGQNFRMNLNNGTPVDANLVAAAVQMDTALNGATTRVDALAYTNNQLGASASTMYVVDSAIDSLCIQEPANAGTIDNCLALATPVDAVDGLDIAPGVDSDAQGNPVTSGSATAVIRLSGETAQRLVQIDLTNAALAANRPVIGNGEIRSLAIQSPPGVPMYALAANGTQLLVFDSLTPGTVITRTITGVAAADELMSIDFNPQTGQLIALAINPGADSGRFYLIAPQTGAAAPTPSSIDLVTDTGAPRDLPLSGPGYAFDFDPASGRAHVIAGTGLNFRMSGGSVLDGNPIAPGTQADPDIDPVTTAVAGLGFTNGAGVGETIATAYAVSYLGDEICRLAPGSPGTLVGCMPLLLPGAVIPLALGSAVGFDIPAEVRAPASGEEVIAGIRALALVRLGAPLRGEPRDGRPHRSRRDRRRVEHAAWARGRCDNGALSAREPVPKKRRGCSAAPSWIDRARLQGAVTDTSSTNTSDPGDVPSRKIATSVTVQPAGMARFPCSRVQVLGTTAVSFCNQG
jgi:hypothetical protein